MDAMDAMDEQQPTTATLAGDDDNTCVVCFDRTKGAALPCGHDHFCSECAKHFRVCPLCREPCAALVHVEGDQGATTVATNDTAETHVLRQNSAHGVYRMNERYITSSRGGTLTPVRFRTS